MGRYLLQSYLDDAYRAHPEKLALVDDQKSMTYRQLHDDANRIAGCLVANGVCRQDRVMICMKRSSQVVLAIMGILKADAVYVPMDAKAPVERLLKVMKDCRPSAIICDDATLPLLDRVRNQLPSLPRLIAFGARSKGGGEVPCVYWEDVAPEVTLPPQYKNIDADAAYILYTSGSTGSPKGVVISHLNVVNYIEWAVEYFTIREEDRVLGTAPFHFDMSTFDIYTVLKVGATLCIAPERFLLFPNKLLDLIESEGVTLWKGVSSLLMYLSSTGSLKEGRIPSLQKILFGGEVLATKHLMNWMQHYPGKRFYNVYGPTETTGISACYPVENRPFAVNEPIPIGKACSNTEIFILTEENRLAEVGETGELCIRGSGLSLGYWDDEEKTARAFIRNPLGCTQSDRIYRSGDLARMREDGVFEYLGRKDFQVKFMGYRIELFEIEQAILAQDSIHQAAVVLCDSAQSEVPELIAFIAGPGLMDLDSIMEELGRVVPSYMLPKRIIPMPEIPLTDRGKTDRVALREIYHDAIQNSAKGIIQ
jgi:D-alanine--poly(phosphoribitol) ligase subunit 1